MIGTGTKKTAWFLDVILIQCYMKNLVAAAVSSLITFYFLQGFTNHQPYAYPPQQITPFVLLRADAYRARGDGTILQLP